LPEQNILQTHHNRGSRRIGTVELPPRREDKLGGTTILQKHERRGSRRIGRGVAVAGRGRAWVQEWGARALKGRREVVAPMDFWHVSPVPPGHAPRNVRSGQAPVWLDVLLARARASGGANKKRPQC
jgi:hypothetical protein